MGRDEGERSVTIEVIYRIIQLMAVVLIGLIIVRVALSHRFKAAGYNQGVGKTCGTKEAQEDCFGISKNNRGTMVVLTDGMGKKQGGALSASLVVETALDIFERDNAFYNPNYFFQKLLNQANRRILDRLDEGAYGASVAIALIDKSTFYYAVVGNVQVAVYRDKELIPITEGHTINVLAEKKYMQGNLTKQETIALLQEQRLYNFVGRDEFSEVEVFDQPIKLKSGDIVILMTDGVYETIGYSGIEDRLKTGGNCQMMADAIVKEIDALQEEKDNGSIVLLSV